MSRNTRLYRLTSGSLRTNRLQRDKALRTSRELLGANMPLQATIAAIIRAFGDEKGVLTIPTAALNSAVLDTSHEVIKSWEEADGALALCIHDTRLDNPDTKAQAEALAQELHTNG